MTITTDALLLRATDYRDADRIVTLFTRAAGKLSAVARGARGSRRRFSGALEPCAVIRVELEPGRGELFSLKRAEIARPFPGILAELARIEAAAAALALMRELQAPQLADEGLFVACLQYLAVVDHEGDPQRSLLLGFVSRVLSLLGSAPRLEVCGRSGERVPEQRPAYFDPALGAVVARRFGGGPFLLSAETRARLVDAQSEQWVQGARQPWANAQLEQARGALAAFLRAHLSEQVAGRLFPSSP